MWVLAIREIVSLVLGNPCAPSLPKMWTLACVFLESQIPFTFKEQSENLMMPSSPALSCFSSRTRTNNFGFSIRNVLVWWEEPGVWVEQTWRPSLSLARPSCKTVADPLNF